VIESEIVTVTVLNATVNAIVSATVNVTVKESATVTGIVIEWMIVAFGQAREVGGDLVGGYDS
jgi:hypothetical protein